MLGFLWSGISHAANFDDIECLARIIYFEARGTSDKEQLVPAFVTLNRAKDKSTTICRVVREPGQFAKITAKIRERGAYNHAVDLAQKVIHGHIRDVTNRATYFHDSSIKRPRSWRHLTYLGRIGAFSLYA